MMEFQSLSRPIWLARILALVALIVSTAATPGIKPPLNFTRLEIPIATIAETDTEHVREAIELIKQGEASLALVRLDNGRSSSLQVFTAYALMQISTHMGAFGCPHDPCDRPQLRGKA